MTAVSSQTDVGRLPGAGNDRWEEGMDAAEGVAGGAGSEPFGRNGSYGSSCGTWSHRCVRTGCERTTEAGAMTQHTVHRVSMQQVPQWCMAWPESTTIVLTHSYSTYVCQSCLTSSTLPYFFLNSLYFCSMNSWRPLIAVVHTFPWSFNASAHTWTYAHT